MFCLSPVGPKILVFGNHCSAKFQLILDCFIPNFMLKNENSENIETDCVDTVVFKLHEIRQRKIFSAPSISDLPRKLKTSELPSSILKEKPLRLHGLRS